MVMDFEEVRSGQELLRQYLAEAEALNRKLAKEPDHDSAERFGRREFRLRDLRGRLIPAVRRGEPIPPRRFSS